MLRQKTQRRLPLVHVTLSLPFWLLAGSAYPQAPFYQGKTITLLVGSGPGGMGDLRAKALASGLNKNIPGNPIIFFQYMPGAEGSRAQDQHRPGISQ
jgi:tripartite-type tricarboxylate transporter receptor subunit TctC